MPASFVPRPCPQSCRQIEFLMGLFLVNKSRETKDVHLSTYNYHIRSYQLLVFSHLKAGRVKLLVAILYVEYMSLNV